MGLSDKVSDWQVCGVIQAAAGAGLAAGMYIFFFYSSAANLSARFRLSGVGAGAGGNASGTALPVEGMGFSPWSSIECDKPFSVYDLNNCWGRLSTLSVGAGVQVGVVYITAAPRFWSTSSYFHSQNVGGLGTGLGAGALVIVGGWHFSSVVGNQPGSSDSSTMA